MKITKSTRNNVKVSEYGVFTTSLPQSVISSYEANVMRRDHLLYELTRLTDQQILAARNKIKAQDDLLDAADALDHYNDNSEVEHLLLCFIYDKAWVTRYEANVAFEKANTARHEVAVAYDRAVIACYYH